MPERRRGEQGAESSFWQDRDRFDAWLQEHPVLLPENVRQQIEAENTELQDKNLTFERWKELGALHRERMKHGQEPDGSLFDQYYRLYVLRSMPGSSRSQIRDLEERLADCFCGSGKKFAECHKFFRQ